VTAFLFGILGVLLALGLLVGGFFLGWKAKSALLEKAKIETAQQTTAEQTRKLEAEQKAFSTILSYNVDTAYGLNNDTTSMITKGE